MADGEGIDKESVGLKAGKLEDLLFLLLESGLSQKSVSGCHFGPLGPSMEVPP